MRKTAFTVFISFLSACLAILIYHNFFAQKAEIESGGAEARYATFHENLFNGAAQRQFLSTAPTDFVNAAEAVTPAVVNIKAVEESAFDFWGGGSYGGSSGSGVIISPDGYVVTNNHVIEDGDKIEVTLNDKKQYTADVIGADPSTDIALLKIEASNLPFIIFSNSDSIRIGEWVLAVGNPFNLTSTVTAGIVSAKGRSINILDDQYSIESFIQTDAAVNPGNSGGALVNTNGELVGINTAIITRSGKYEGYSFAIPANLAQKIIHDLKVFGVVQRGILGVEIKEVDHDIAQRYGIETLEGILVTRVTKNSGADDAGLKIGDIIVAINGVSTISVPELQEQVARYRPGNTLMVDYLRENRKSTARVVLKNKRNSTALLASGDYKYMSELGFELRDLTQNEFQGLRQKGAKVVSIERGSKIYRTNMDPGFIITIVNDKKVSSVEEVIEAIRRSTGKVLLEGVYEDYPGEYYYAFAK